MSTSWSTIGRRSARGALVQLALAALTASLVSLFLVPPASALYPPKSGETHLATTPTRYGYGSPEVYGSKVYYAVPVEGTDDARLYVYDLATNREKRLPSRGWVAGISASSSWVVYDTRDVMHGGSAGVRCLNLRTGTDLGLGGADPEISGSSVVWLQPDCYGGSPRDCKWYGNIFHRNLATGVTTQVTTSNTASHPSVRGSLVAYDDTRSGVSCIYIYDLRTGQERVVGRGQWPAFGWGSALIWSNVTTAQVTDPGMPFTWRCQYLVFYAAPYQPKSVYVTVAPGATTQPIKGYEMTSGRLFYQLYEASHTIDGVRYPAVNSVFMQFLDHPSWQSEHSPRQLATGTGLSAYGSTAVYTDRRDGAYHVYLYETKPAARLGTPVADSTMSRTRSFPVYGSLRPKHVAGSTVGKLQCYRYYSGAWHKVKTYTLKASDYSTYSRYNTRVKLDRAGKWRIRAWHYDAGHASSFSAWRYVTVR